MDTNRQQILTQGAAGDPRPVAPTAEEPAGDIYRLSLPGRALMTGTEDQPCTLVWVQGRLARIAADEVAGVEVGGRAIFYLHLIGRVVGTVTRVGPGEIDVVVIAPIAKWLRLQQLFAVLAAMAPEDREIVREHRRIVLDAPDVAVSLHDGRTDAGRVQDVSRSGAAVISRIAPEIGSLVTLGTTRGRVVRLLDDGFAVQFLRLLPLEWFTPAYVL